VRAGACASSRRCEGGTRNGCTLRSVRGEQQARAAAATLDVRVEQSKPPCSEE
jgi:hypothetical protein